MQHVTYEQAMIINRFEIFKKSARLKMMIDCHNDQKHRLKYIVEYKYLWSELMPYSFCATHYYFSLIICFGSSRLAFAAFWYLIIRECTQYHFRFTNSSFKVVIKNPVTNFICNIIQTIGNAQKYRNCYLSYKKCITFSEITSSSDQVTAS